MGERDPLEFESNTYKLNLMTPNFSPRPTGLPRIPIALATVGPMMLRLAGEAADAVILHPFSTKKYLMEVSTARLNEGLAKGGRARENLEVIAGGYGFIATGGTPEAVEKARQYARYRISFYCSTRAYWDVLRLHDLEWLGERLNPFPRENRWSEMAAQIPEDKIDLFATVADYASLPAAIEARYGGYAELGHVTDLGRRRSRSSRRVRASDPKDSVPFQVVPSDLGLAVYRV